MIIDRSDPPRPQALLYFFDGVRAYFKKNAVSTPVTFGFRERGRQITQGIGATSRVVIVPGKIGNGGDGAFAPVKGPGGNPRKLFTQGKIATLSIFAGSLKSPDERDEAALVASLDVMLEQMLSAIQAVLQQNVTLGAANYNANPDETRFGLEYLVELTIDGRYFALEEAVPTAGVTPIVNRGGVENPPNPT